MKKKILHVYNIMNRGGAETFIMNIYNNIDKQLFEFDFLCTSNEKGKYNDNIINNGGKVFNFNKFSSKRILFNIKYTYDILKKNGPYDAIHIPMQFYSFVFCISAKLAGVKKIIVHSHSAGDYSNKNILRRIYMMFSRKIINTLATDKIACGLNAGDYLFGKKTKYKIIYNGIDLSRFGNISDNKKQELKSKYNLNNAEVIIGHVGNFSPVKNHNFFIDLAHELKKRKLHYKILLVGDGKEKKNIENKIKYNNLDEFFSFTGSVDNVNELYSIMDIFVMPSLYEGFPVSIIEALASGLPCVLSNKITREVMIIPNECLFFDLNEQIEKICDLICDNCENHFNAKFNQKKLDNFNINTVSKQIISIYCK